VEVTPADEHDWADVIGRTVGMRGGGGERRLGRRGSLLLFDGRGVAQGGVDVRARHEGLRVLHGQVAGNANEAAQLS
jgi:hypothetical protein